MTAAAHGPPEEASRRLRQDHFPPPLPLKSRLEEP